jgi:hypothetical protein
MGALTKATDTVYTLRFLRLLTTPWEETNAFKLGLIDNKGNKLKKPFTEKEKSSYNMFHRLVFNIKKLINKVPGGSSKIASYATALFLIKEHLNLSDKSLEKILKECEIDPSEFLNESSQWFTTKDGMLSPGIYRLSVESKMVNSTGDELCKKFDKVRVEMDTYPVANLFGLDIYEAIHTPTLQKIYVTAGELLK